MIDLHYLTHNIIIGKAELFYVPVHKGWSTPGGTIITDKIEAINYACKLHDFIVKQSILANQKDKK